MFSPFDTRSKPTLSKEAQSFLDEWKAEFDNVKNLTFLMDIPKLHLSAIVRIDYSFGPDCIPMLLSVDRIIYNSKRVKRFVKNSFGEEALKGFLEDNEDLATEITNACQLTEKIRYQMQIKFNQLLERDRIELKLHNNWW